ncbi:MAG: DUF2950 domain-containing protein [Betaproteobacteria bacterium]
MNRTLTSLETTMHHQYGRAHAARVWAVLPLLLMAMLLVSTRAFGAETQQKTFATPDEAVNALVAAAKANDAKAIRAVLGNDPGDLSSGDAVADRALREQFVTAYDAKHALATAADATKLTIGNDDFPFAFPLVKTGERWHFDTKAGRDELLARRIGANELDAIKVLQAVVDAEREYVTADRNGNGVIEYAMKFASSSGKRDGLYWPAKAGDPPSPLGELVVKAAGEGYRAKQGTPTPFHGYYYRMLKGQTASATGGAADFVVRGHAIAGFAVIAYPAKYASSGIMTFMVNQDGVVYQADLGPATQAKASKMQKFDPGSGWSKVTTP